MDNFNNTFGAERAFDWLEDENKKILKYRIWKTVWRLKRKKKLLIKINT